MRVSKLLCIRAPALFLSVSLFLSVVFSAPAYAQATPLDADSVDGGSVYYDVSDYDSADYGSDDGIVLLDEGLSVRKIENTISYSGLKAALWYNNTRGGTSWLYVNVGSDGHFTMTRPSDFSSPRRLEFRLDSINLPVTGNYAYAYNIIPDSGITYVNSYDNARIFVRFNYVNANYVSKTYSYIDSSNFGSTFITNSAYGEMYTHNGKNGAIVEYSTFGEFYAYSPSIGFINSNLGFSPYVDITEISFPFNAYFRAAFTATGTQPVFTTPGSAPSSENIQQDISNAVGNISSTVSQVASGVADVANKVSGVTSAVNALPAKIAASMEPHYNNILQQLHHITEQLHAFWDQLAAYFNDKLIPQMITDTNRIVDAINGMDLNVDVSFSEITNVLNKNHQEQLANDDKNADDMMNSYNNQSFNTTNEKLSNSLTEYEQKESELLNQVQGHIDQMDYADPFSQMAAPLADLSFFLTGIYTGLGAFNIPIAFSLTLTIALLCIGWYRFRGG